MYSLEFDSEWKNYFDPLDNSIKIKIVKKIKKILEGSTTSRHLKYGKDLYVEQVGQYRILYKTTDNARRFYFVGDHKEYEKWIDEKR